MFLKREIIFALANLYGPGFFLFGNVAVYATMGDEACLSAWQVALYGIGGGLLGVGLSAFASSAPGALFVLGLLGITINCHAIFGIFGSNAAVSVGACVLGLIGAGVYGVGGKPCSDIVCSTAVLSFLGIIYHIVYSAIGFSPTYEGVVCERGYCDIGLLCSAVLHGLFFSYTVKGQTWASYLLSTVCCIYGVCMQSFLPRSMAIPTMIQQAMDALHRDGMDGTELAFVTFQFSLLAIGASCSAFFFHWTLQKIDGGGDTSARKVDPERTFTLLFVAFALSSYLLNFSMPVIIVIYSVCATVLMFYISVCGSMAGFMVQV
jgi:hypothetical protein